MADATAPAPKQIGLRTLVINAMFSMFLATVVFVVGTYFFVIPKLLQQKTRIEQLEQQVAELQQGTEDDTAESEDAEAEDGDEAAQAPAEDGAAAAQPAMAPAAQADAGR